MKQAGKEPFPTIYVDVKPDSDAAKAGARYEVIAKAQLKKMMDLPSLSEVDWARNDRVGGASH